MLNKLSVSLRALRETPHPPDSLPEGKGARWDRFDSLFLLACLGWAFLMWYGQFMHQYPDVILGGDAANITGFAAASDHPDWFRGDLLLSDPANFRIYATVHIPLIRALTHLTGNYSQSFNLILLPQAFLQLFGFYVFGRQLFKNRFWAVLLSLVNIAPFAINLEESWGLSYFAVPRQLFQALLPFLLALVLRTRKDWRIWPVWMALCGLLVYAHPVSTPAWAAALGVGIFSLTFTSTTARWGWPRRLGWVALCGFAFVSAALPFILNYMNSHVQGASTNYDLVYSTIVESFPRDLLDTPAAVVQFVKITTRSGLLPLGLLGLGLLLFIRPRQQADLRLVLTWAGGILLMSVFIPWIEHSLERALRLIPLETELARGLRYIPFFFILFILWALLELRDRLKPHWMSKAAAVSATVLVALWLVINPLRMETMRHILECWRSAQVLCSHPVPETDIIHAVRQYTPPGSTIYSALANQFDMAFSQSVRYLALRPLVYSFKDRGLLVYSNAETLAKWDQVHQELVDISTAYSERERPRQWYNQAVSLGAEYMIAPNTFNLKPYAELPVTLLFQDNRYLLFQIHPAQ